MDNVSCEYLKNGDSCSAISGNDEARAARHESCENDNEEACCYFCPFYHTCRISCVYLGENKRKRTSDLKIDDKTETTPKPIVRKCPLCDLKMRHARINLRVGGWEGYYRGLPFGISEIGEDQERLLPVVVYVCLKCGKLEFFAGEKTKQRISTGSL